MKKLSKDQIATRTELSCRFHEQWQNLDEAVTAYNTAVSEQWAKVEDVLATYNEVIADANAFKQDVAANIQEYIDARSDKWHETDKASEYASWIEQYEDEFEQVDLGEGPEELSLQDVENHEELIDGLPEELEG